MSRASPTLAAELAQVVLAAGGSSRMGEPKALLDFGDRTALELVVEAAAAVAARSVVVVSPAGAAWRERLRFPGLLVDWVVNDRPASEQIDSLAFGLRRLEKVEAASGRAFAAFFVQPVDCPLVTADDYRRLAAALAACADPQTSVFKPRAGGRHGHPILCRRALLEAFLAAAAAGETARDVVGRARAASVDCTNPDLAEDMDSPADYRRLLALHEARRSGNGERSTS
jgi:molybdenum cofactor cytidylyltransferase